MLISNYGVDVRIKVQASYLYFKFKKCCGLFNLLINDRTNSISFLCHNTLSSLYNNFISSFLRDILIWFLTTLLR